MSRGLKFVLAIADLVLFAIVGTVLYVAFGLSEVAAKLAKGANFSWENFNPLSRDPGILGITPLVWTALLITPLAVLLPALVYWYEKKQVPHPVRFALARMRVVALILLYLIIAGPSLVDSRFLTEGSKVAVLIDDSLSMGGEAREFSIFNVLDDAESADVQKLQAELRAAGLTVGAPQPKGFVTLAKDELELRNFVRKVVSERAQRLLRRLAELHGEKFDITRWQNQRAMAEQLARSADRKQSELSAENNKDNPDQGVLRRLQAELQGLLHQLQNTEADFARQLKGDMKDPVVRRKRALIDNLLETVHPEGPRRWDIACELVMPGNKLSAPQGSDMALLDALRKHAAEIEAKNETERDGTTGANMRRVAAIRYFVFSTKFGRAESTEEAILEVQPEDLDFRAPQGRLTELDQALIEVRRYYTPDDDLACILVFTDGRDTTEGDSASRAARALRTGKRAVELAFVAVGNPKPVKVLELLSVSADKEILKGDFVDFKLKIRADKAYRADPKTGRAGKRVKIILCEDSDSPDAAVTYAELNGNPVRNARDMEIELPPEDVAEVKIRYKPVNAGRRTYYIKLNEDRFPDEDTYRNNVAVHYLVVKDQKIKLLYLEQGFRWEARALDQALRRDRKLEYQGYFFDADAGWRQPTSAYDDEVRAKVKPLGAPFHDGNNLVRDKDAFMNLNYDVIILGDIDPNAQGFRLEHWEWIEEWVSRNRGGLILLSGIRHNPRSYVNIERARALYPVELDLPTDYEKAVNTQVMKYWRLTPSGRSHEVMRLSTNPERNDELWGSVKEGKYQRGQLNGLYWYAKAGSLKPAPAQALARAAFEGPITGEGDVLIASMPYGNGMVFYVASDETFRMRETVGDVYFYRFWQNAMRFVASRRLAGKQQRVDVYTDRTEYQIGDEVNIYVDMLGPNIYDEVVQHQLTELKELPTTGTETDARRLIVEVRARVAGALTGRRVVLTEEYGTFVGKIDANEAGQFDIWVRGYEESRTNPHRYVVLAPVAELRRLTLDMDGLIERASALPSNRAPLPYQAGKRVYLVPDVGQAAIETRERINEIKGLTKLMWDTESDPWTLRSLLLAALVMILAGEWLTRKLVRMV